MELTAVQGTRKSLLQHHSSKASILWHSAFFIVQVSHPYMTTGKTIPLTRWTFVGKVMYLLLNMLSRTLPRRCQLHPFLRRDDHKCLQTLPDVPWGWGAQLLRMRTTWSSALENLSRGRCKPLDSLRCSEGQCGVRAERPALSVPQLQWGTTSRDHQTHQERGTGGRKEGQAQKKADQGVVCYPISLPSPAMSITFLPGLGDRGGTAECDGPTA